MRSRLPGSTRLPCALLCLALALASSPALAEPDAFGLGNGQHGALRVQRMDTTINTATALAQSATAGSTSLAVASSEGFAAGELVLVHQVFAESASLEQPSGPIELLDVGAGRFEFARLAAVESTTLRLTAPLSSPFTAPGSQVVRVPEYTSVHVQPSSALLAPPWNGSSGGVLVFLAMDFVLNQGVISADGAGFRGGTFAGTSANPTGCTEPHQSEATGGASKGEGLFSAVSGVPTHGYAALGNGAGGGNCEDGGGGGGGHGGAGGQGGFTTPADGARDVGGRGGAALSYSPLRRLMFGGGGGAGAGGTSGAAGGGIISFRARDLQGSQGRIRANGLSAAAATNDGAGGGGAGGSISVRVEGKLDCAGIEALGGNGGSNTDTREAHGPGGGGGGGVVLLQGATLGCSATVLPGLAGTAAGASGSAHGATPTSNSQPENQGITTPVNEGFVAPTGPVWTFPEEGQVTGPRPRFEGTAQPGSTVYVFLDEQPQESVAVSEAGTFSFTPTVDLTLGTHQVRGLAERLGVRGAPSEPRAFRVGTPSPLALDVGCACGTTRAASGGGLALGVGVLEALRRRSSRSARKCR